MSGSALTFTHREAPRIPEALGPEGDQRSPCARNPNVLDRREPEVMINTLTSKSEEADGLFLDKGYFTKTCLHPPGEVRTIVYRYLDEKGIHCQLRYIEPGPCRRHWGIIAIYDRRPEEYLRPCKGKPWKSSRGLVEKRRRQRNGRSCHRFDIWLVTAGDNGYPRWGE